MKEGIFVDFSYPKMCKSFSASNINDWKIVPERAILERGYKSIKKNIVYIPVKFPIIAERDREKYGVAPLRCRKEILEELKDIVVEKINSFGGQPLRIYIKSHHYYSLARDSEYKHYIGHEIEYKENEYDKFKKNENSINISYIESILKEIHLKKNIEIRLFTCNDFGIGNAYMKLLRQNNFIDSFVVSYKNDHVTRIKYASNPNTPNIITDHYTKINIPFLGEKPRAHGFSADNKWVNYLNNQNIEKVLYTKFKKEHYKLFNPNELSYQEFLINTFKGKVLSIIETLVKRKEKIPGGEILNRLNLLLLNELKEKLSKMENVINFFDEFIQLFNCQTSRIDLNYDDLIFIVGEILDYFSYDVEIEEYINSNGLSNTVTRFYQALKKIYLPFIEHGNFSELTFGNFSYDMQKVHASLKCFIENEKCKYCSTAELDRFGDFIHQPYCPEVLD